MMKLVLFLLGVATFGAAIDTHLTGSNWQWVIQNFSGFNYFRANTSWTITTESDSTIKLFCQDIKLPSPNFERRCDLGKLTFDDGKTKTQVCGQNENTVIVGKTSKMAVDFTVSPGSGGVFFCKGKSVHPPKSYETINVEPRTKTRFDYQEVLGKNSDKAYIFKSTNGGKVTLVCTTDLYRAYSGQCIDESLTLDAGNGADVTCGKGATSATGTEIKMRIEIQNAMKGKVSCIAKA